MSLSDTLSAPSDGDNVGGGGGSERLDSWSSPDASAPDGLRASNVGVRGDLLLPKTAHKTSLSHQAVGWAVLGSGCMVLYGMLTRVVNHFDSVDEREIVGQRTPRDQREGASGTSTDRTAAMWIDFGIVLFVLAAVTAAVNGQLEHFVTRLKEKPCHRGAGYLSTVAYLSALVTLPFVVQVTFSPQHPWWRPHDVAWMVAGVFTAMTTMMSVREVKKHLENYSSSRMQKHIIRILFMPPIYAIDCFASIRFNSLGIYLSVFREIYEALCLWSFMSLMMNFLHNVAEVRRQQADAKVRSCTLALHGARVCGSPRLLRARRTLSSARPPIAATTCARRKSSISVRNFGGTTETTLASSRLKSWI